MISLILYSAYPQKRRTINLEISEYQKIDGNLEQVLFEAESEIQSIKESLFSSELDDETIVKSVAFIQSYHGKIDWDVAKRMLQAIYRESPIRRTSLSMKSGLNYGAGKRYLAWMEELGWIVISKFQQRVRLTELGMKMCERLALHQTNDNGT